MQESFAPRGLRDMSTAVLVLNRKGYIMYVNRPASEMLELNPDLVPGTRHFKFFSENLYNDDFYQYILEAIYHKSDTHIGKVHYQTPSGRKYIFHISSSFLAGSDAGDDRIVITLADETKEELLQEKILSSLIFAAMHMHLGFLFMLGAAILASLEGILYEKQQSILGVWIVHWVFGVCGTMLWLIDH